MVATCVGGIPYILHHGVNGLLVPPGNAGELCAKLKQLLLDKSVRMQMGACARERFVQRYTLTKFYEGLTGIFEQVLHNKVRK